jgi:rod shape-determining protein MreC
MPRFRRLNYLLIIVVVLLIGQLALFRSVRDFGRQLLLQPVGWLDRGVNHINNFFIVVSQINSLSKENSQLKQTNISLQAQLADLGSIQAENEQLKKDLAFAQSRSDLTLLPAHVVSYSPIENFQALTIDRGTNDGLKAEAAVIAQGYLIGKIKNIAPKTAEVWLLANPNLLTPITLPKSNTTGILQGGLSGLVVSNIPINANVTPGDPVVTSALQGLYPPNLPVGTVQEIISRKEDIFISVRLSTAINADSLETVFVVK